MSPCSSREKACPLDRSLAHIISNEGVVFAIFLGAKRVSRPIEGQQTDRIPFCKQYSGHTFFCRQSFVTAAYHRQCVHGVNKLHRRYNELHIPGAHLNSH